jgi:hypothetical protein
MKKAVLYLVLSLFFILSPPAHGDGIPVSADLRNVTMDCFAIHLNEAQVKQVERHRKITLTREQFAPLLAIYDRVPQTINVVSSRWDSCTCGFGVYAIWCRPGEVSIPRYSVLSQKDEDEYIAENPTQTEESETGANEEEFESKELILDSAGKMYLDGREIQEREVLALADAMHERKSEVGRLKCYLYLDPPPPIDEATDAKIRELSDHIEAYCKERRISYWATGFSADKQRQGK